MRQLIYPYDTTYFHFEYEQAHFINGVVSLRGGRTRGGFMGMISFPLAIALDENRSNYFLEYSVFGVFGIKKTKFGIGHMGMIKKRDTDSVTVIGGIYSDDYVSREAYMLFPCLKVAQLFGNHIVASLNFELGGSIIPRFENDFDDWRPSMGLDFLFSFGKLDGPNIMDGAF